MVSARLRRPPARPRRRLVQIRRRHTGAKKAQEVFYLFRSTAEGKTATASAGVCVEFEDRADERSSGETMVLESDDSADRSTAGQMDPTDLLFC